MPTKKTAKKPASKSTTTSGKKAGKTKPTAAKKATAKKASPSKGKAASPRPAKSGITPKAGTPASKAGKSAATKAAKPAGKATTKAGGKAAVATGDQGAATASKGKAKKKVKETKAASRPKASELISNAAHTPAIFRPGHRRSSQVLFTMEDIREVLRKRAKEESQNKARQAATVNGTTAPTVDKDQPQVDTPARNSRHSAATLEDILGIGGSSPKTGPGNVPRKWQKFHKLLVDLRDHVRAELNLHSNDTLKRSQKEDAGDISISVDAGTDNFDRDFALSLLSSEQETLKEIEAAIQRIYNGTYGVCEVTGEPINLERLEAVPFTRYSLEGQREHELNSRRRVSRTGAFISEVGADAISFGDDDGDS